MAQEKKYKLGELEFETEQEYREAAGDLKRIQGLMAKYDVADPAQAAKILSSIKAHPETFRSPYGRKFVEKLEAAAGKSASGKSGNPFSAGGRSESGNPFSAGGKPASGARSAKDGSRAAKQEKKLRKQQEKQAKKAGGADGEKEKFQIFTVRNFAVGIIIIACVIVFSIFAPQLFSFNGNGDSNGDIRLNMVTEYARNQADLKAKLYTYYFNVVGETEQEAEKNASAGIGNYVMDLSDRTVSSMTESEITDVYDQLVEGGDIQNNSFVEPAEITVLKEKLLAAGLSNNTGNGVEGETVVVAAINSMMDYQERMFYSLCYDYSLLSYQAKDYEKFASEDMDAMFGEVIYDYKMEEEEKQKYFDSFLKRGLIKDNQVVRFSTDPTAYNLPDLTPVIEVSLKGEKAQAYQCSMISYAPAASVFYEIHSGNEKGYLCFRNNGQNTNYIQLDEETSVTAQGDFFMLRGSRLLKGEWFFNRQDIGLLIKGDSKNVISYVHDLTY